MTVHKQSYRREALPGRRDHLVGFTIDKCIFDFYIAYDLFDKNHITLLF